MIKLRDVISILALVSATLLPSADARPQESDPEQSARIAEFENGLRPPYGVAGEEPEVWSLEERMQHYNVPGVSIAVAIDGELVWARGYGVRDSESGGAVDTDTLFQAASLSKPVAALAALALVQDEVLALDQPANAFLTRWHIPDNEFTAQQPVTIRHLLSHRGGTTIHGFRGYPLGAGLPSLPQILAGTEPANTEPVIVTQLPGESYRYSGGGYTILQLAIEDASGRSFADVVEGRIFHPAGMARSHFRYPVGDANAAIGHAGPESASMSDEQLAYPELAAAGMWTTPSELVRLGSLVARSRNTEHFFLDQGLARQLVPDNAGEPGLGFGLNNDGDGVAFVHSGHNPGYSARWINYADGRASVAVLTNSDSGGDLIREILSAIGHIYGWKQDAHEVRETIAPGAAAMQAIAGQYGWSSEDDDPFLTISIVDGELWVDGAVVDRARLHAQSGTRYFVTKGLNFEAELDVAGKVTAIIVQDEIRLVPLG
ncbi:serine hydrolase domain-containing protein [Aurantiacibacter sp. D1-12]|uniref:serine hydrolase domain-containing protein n=1 Tax=Aurantiacibacter sp. D1-12 TaxID=2993658 RepID=UPI00237D2C67|nr:serine hydrolase domain-containing protein [Aurantiacibacter sp. D1-12]MDE1468493.1 serine hydrolase [Aurantiacibacter sp. D1-12]